MRVVAVIIEGEADASTIDAIRSAMATPGFTCVRAMPKVSDIIRRVAFETGVSTARIVSRVRELPAERARFAVTLFAYALANRTTSEIGRAMGGRTISTIDNQLKRGRALMDSDPAFPPLMQRLADHFLPGESL